MIEEMKGGYIYILTNPSFPDFVKIGYADDVEKRVQQLNRSESVPFSFEVFAYYKVNSRLTDMKLHNLIDYLNPNLRSREEKAGKKRVREFFRMSPAEAYNILEAIAEINGLKNNLVLVQKHNDDAIEEKQNSLKEHTVAQKERKEFWIKMNDYIEKNGISINIRKPSINYWYDVSLGNSSSIIKIKLVNHRRKIRVELLIKDNKDLFRYLYDNKTEIENALSFNLDWENDESLQDSSISTNIYGLDYSDKSNYEDLIAQTIEEVIFMREVFVPHIEAYKKK